MFVQKSDLDHSFFHLIVFSYHIDIHAGLILGNGFFGNQWGVRHITQKETGLDIDARQKRLFGIGDDSPHVDGIGLGISGVVDKIHLSRVGMGGAVGKDDVHGDLFFLSVLQNQAQILLTRAEIDVDGI